MTGLGKRRLQTSNGRNRGGGCYVHQGVWGWGHDTHTHCTPNLVAVLPIFSLCFSKFNPVQSPVVTICTTALISKAVFCVRWFHMIARINIDNFPKQHFPVDRCHGDALSFLCGTD
jgi:hypothetical protein